MAKRKILIPLFIVALMVFSAFGVVLSSFGTSNEDTFKYKDYRFTFNGQTWSTFKNDQRIDFSIDPRELEAVYIGDIINKLSNHNRVYLSVDPEQNLDTETQFFKGILGQLFQKPIINACPSDNEFCNELPLKDCQDAIPSQVLIIKLESGDNNIQEDESCIAILGNRGYFIQILEKIRLEMIL